MLARQLDQIAYCVPDELLKPFNEMVASMRPNVSPLLASGYYDDQQPIDVLNSCGELLKDAQRVAHHCQVDPNFLTQHPEADVMVAGVVNWHHDEGACLHTKRMLIAYPGIEGFVLHVARPQWGTQCSEEAVTEAANASPSQVIRKSIPLTPGTVVFIDHHIYHRVSFKGDITSLNGAPATLFLDFGVDKVDYADFV